MKPPSSNINFDTFPPTVKRKYFSSLERLRLAQTCTTSKPSSSCSWDPSPFKAPGTPTRPTLNRSKSSSYLRPSSRRSRKAATNEHLSTADAQLFLKLPEKLQRRHFTHDEQRMLAGHCEEVIFDATDATLYRLGRQSNRSVPSLRPSSSSSASTNSSFYFEAEQDPVDSAINMDDAVLENFRWLDSHDHLDLTLDDYHSHVVEAAGAKSLSDRRPSFHKNPLPSAMPPPSNRPVTSRRSRSPRAISPISRISLEKESSHERQISHASTNFLPIHQNSPSSDPTAVRYYQDREARLKLRVYLGSPSKFDEAIEFGFPPLPAPERPSLFDRRYATAPANPETFFDDSTPSLFNALDNPSEDDEAESSSLPDLDPGTPSSAIFTPTHRLPRPFHESNIDLRSALKPKLRYLAPEPPRSSSGSHSAAREMTLRMTLTRPELRMEEEKGKSDPLALAELPPARNGRTIWDAAPREKGWKRVWRRMSGKKGED